MTPLAPSLIHSWHAHVYFDAASRDAAFLLEHPGDLHPHVRLVGARSERAQLHFDAIGQRHFAFRQLSSRSGIDLFAAGDLDKAVEDLFGGAAYLGQGANGERGSQER